jgi:hypothetical protein
VVVVLPAGFPVPFQPLDQLVLRGRLLFPTRQPVQVAERCDERRVREDSNRALINFDGPRQVALRGADATE